jgi:hypothetical protein
MRDLKKEIKNKLALEPPRISLEFVKLFGNKKTLEIVEISQTAKIKYIF